MKRSKASRAPPARPRPGPAAKTPSSLPPIQSRKNSLAEDGTKKNITRPNSQQQQATGKVPAKNYKVLPSITGKQGGRERLGSLAQHQSFRDSLVMFGELLKGRLHDLPPKPPSEVRVFLSSTFTDMKVERNWLSTAAYPRLKQYCSNLGLDFSMLDMRWGVTDDATNEHITEILCLKEVKNCQRNSIGPNFVAFLGNKYGYRPLPAMVRREEFEVLMQEAVTLEHPGCSLLQTWYRLDTNAIPNVYCLQPIKQILPHFGDHSEGNEDKRLKAAQEWHKTQEKLQEVLRQAALAAESKGLLSAKAKHTYFRSVTECEISEGILEAKNPNQHSVCYYREMEGLNNDVVHETNAQRFMDCIEKDEKIVEDEEVKGMLTTLCTQTIPAVVNKSNIKKYTIPWLDGGTDPCNDQHRSYLESLTEDFVTDLERLIDEGLLAKSSVIPQTEFYTRYEECLHHLHFTVEKCETFKGQDAVLDAIREKLAGPASSHLILVAESGVGKTSLIAMTMKMIPQWFGTDCIGIVRYLGTSTESSDILSVLRNITGQLADVAQMLVEPDNMRSMKRIVKYLPRLIRNVSRKVKSHIFILLDSIDQLKNTDGAYNMKWLPVELPRNVTIVISTLTSRFGIADNLKQLLPKDDHYLHIHSLPASTGPELMNIILKKNNRALTEEQMALIVPKMEKFPNALYMKLLIDRSLTWSSFTSVDDIQIAPTVKEAVNMLFNVMENTFGRTLISRTLGYLTEGLSGLTEVELEDVLSCDDEVLDEVYRYHDPPVEGVVRLPALLWSRIKESISRYLTEKLSAQKTTLSWYHRQFHETATERYSKKEEKLLHSRLVELYQATEGVKRDIFLSKRKKLIREADRQVARQPMTSSNHRMLECIPYHSQKSGDQDLQKRVALCNLDFMMLRIEARGLHTLIADIARCMTHPDQELELVQASLRALKSAPSVLKNLPTELLLRLSPDETHPYINTLLNKAREYVTNCDPAAVPLFSVEDSALVFRQDGCCKTLSVSKSHPEVTVELADSHKDGDSRYLKVNLVNKTASFVKSLSTQLVEKHKMPTWASTGIYQFPSITSLAFNEHETYVLAIYSHRHVVLWDVKNTVVKNQTDPKIAGYASRPFWLTNGICCVCAVSPSNNNCLFVFNTNKSNTQIIDLPYPVDTNKISYTTEYVICATKNEQPASLMIVDIGKNNVAHTVSFSDTKPVWCHSGDVVITYQEKTITKINLHNSKTGSPLAVTSRIASMVLSFDGDVIVASTDDGMLILLNIEDGKTRGQVKMETYSDMAFTNGMKELVTININGQFSVWKWLQVFHSFIYDSNTPDVNGKEILSKCCMVEDVVFSNDNLKILTVGGGVLKIWDCETLELSHKECIPGVALNPVAHNNKNLFLISTSEGNLVLYDLDTHKVTELINPSEGQIEHFDIGINICYVLVKSEKSFAIHSINLEDQSKSVCLLSPKLTLNQAQVQLTTNERYLVISHTCTESEQFAIKKQEKTHNFGSVSYGFTRLYAWDIKSAPQTLKACNRQLTTVPCLAESWVPITDELVLIGRSRVTIIWNIEKDKNDQKIGPNKIPMMYRPYWIEGEKEEQKLCHGQIRCIAKSQDGRLVATGSDDGWLMVYDVTTGHCVQKSLIGTKPHHAAPIINVSLSPSGAYVVSLDKENTLQLFSMALKGHLVLKTKVIGHTEKMIFNNAENRLVILISRGNALSKMLMFEIRGNKL